MANIEDRRNDPPGATRFDQGQAAVPGVGDATFKPPAGTTQLPYVGDDYYVDNAGVKAAPLNLAPPAPKPNLISIEGGDADPKIDPETAESRAEKAHVSMGDASPGMAVLRADFQAGNEERVRARAALAEQIKARQVRQQLIQDVINKHADEGLVPTEDTKQEILHLSDQQIQDPNTVLEMGFARSLTNGVAIASGPDSEDAFKEAYDADPEAAYQTLDAAEAVLVRQEIANRNLEDAQQRYKDISWRRYGVDLGKTLFPLVSWYNLSSATSEYGGTDGWLGTSLEHAISGLYLLPPNEFKERVGHITDELAKTNELDAIRFAAALVNYSDSDAVWDNAYSTLDLAGAAGLAAPKAAQIGKVIGTAATIGKGFKPEAEAIEAAKLAQQTKMGVKPVKKPSLTVTEPELPGSVMGGRKTTIAGEEPPGSNRAPIVKLQERLRAAGKANSGRRIKASDGLVVSGNIEDASKEVMLKEVQDVVNPNPATASRQIDDLASQQPGLFDPNVYARAPGSLTGERVRRLKTALSNVGQDLIRMWTDAPVIPRVTSPVANELAFAKAEGQFRKIYHNLEDTIVDVIPERKADVTFGGVDHINVYLGTKEATGFDSIKDAELHASEIYGLSKGSYGVVPKDGNYFIKMTQPVDETDYAVRLKRVGTDNQANVSTVNALIGWLRSPDDILSAAHTAKRKALVFGGNAVIDAARDALKGLQKISNAQRERLREVLKANSMEIREYTLPDGTKQRLPGNYYDTFGAFEMAYHKRFGSVPTAAETEAYFTLRQVGLWDWYTRNVSYMRDKLRVGGQQFSVLLPVATKNKTTLQASPFFEGRMLEKLPDWNSEPFTIAYIDEKGKGRFTISTNPQIRNKKAQDKLLSDIQNGKVHVVQPLNPVDPVIRDFIDSGGEPINYIVAKTKGTKPLNSVQVEFRYGPHQMYGDEGIFMKQPRVWPSRFGRRIQGADVTAFYFNSVAKAQKFTARMEKAREMINAGAKDAELGRFIKGNLPYKSAKALRKQFGEGGPFSLDVPFVVTKSGQKVSDVIDLKPYFKEPIVRAAESEHYPLKLADTRFTQERDNGLLTINEAGSEANPVFKLTPAPQLDPFETVSRATSGLINQRLMQDYRLGAVEDWATQFGDLLADPTLAKADPLAALKNPRWRAGATGLSNPMALARTRAAMDSRRAILSFLGQETKTQSFFKYARDKVLDSAYKRFGQKGVDTIEPWMWNEKTNPLGMVRGFTTHMFLGMFNPLQFAVQGVAVAQVAAIDGNVVRAAKANYMYWLMRGLRMGESNEAFVAKMQKAAAKGLDVPKPLFDEMYEWAKKSGILHVEGEQAFVDRYLDYSLLPTVKDGLANASLYPFREGNRMVRGVAFNTAFMSWREANPGAKVTNEALRKITARADLLSNNQTFASNNPLYQRGISSIPTQFFSYFFRLSEQMVGGRLTPMEKARMMLVYSATFGVPTGTLGLVAGSVYPVQERTRQFALENNWDPEDPRVQLFFEGLGGMAMKMAAGNDVNWAERYGPAGVTWLRDLTEALAPGGNDGDASVILGASGSVIRDIMDHSEPFTSALYYFFDPEPNKVWPISTEDVITAFREISTVNNVARGVYAWQTGQLLTRGGVYVGDMDHQMSAFMTITGMTPEAANDQWIKARSIKEMRAGTDAIVKQAKIYFDRGIKALEDGNYKDWKYNWTRGRAFITGLPLTNMEQGGIIKRLMTGDSVSKVDEIGRQFIYALPSENRTEQLRIFLKQQEQENK